MPADRSRLIVFNAAEAILEPFWDPALSGLARSQPTARSAWTNCRCSTVSSAALPSSTPAATVRRS
jgi:hypothetical protein